jgi:probable HAF family extracellular repeat protein
MKLHRRLLSLFMLTVAFSPASVSAVQYTIQALDVLPGGGDSRAFGLNDQIQVVGDSRLDRSGHIGQSRPVVWDASGGASEFTIPVELWNDPFVGGSAADINNHGVVVGRYGSGTGIPLPGPGVPFGRGFVWDSTNGRRDIGLEPVGNTQAVAINDAGQVVGTSEVLVIIGGSNFFAPRAFIWDESNGIQEIGTLGGSFSFANDVNESGQVIGYSETQDGFERAFIWDKVNEMQELPTIAGSGTRATAINDLGLVVGGEFGFGGFLWDATNGIRTIPIGGYDINNHGQVVGGPVGDVAIWDQTNGVQRLVNLIPANSGWEFEIAFSINDDGNIVGFGRLNGQTRGFLMTPIPEPPTLLLAVFAILTTAIARRHPARLH